jgi:hypothetical protein
MSVYHKWVFDERSVEERFFPAVFCVLFWKGTQIWLYDNLKKKIIIKESDISL